MDQTISEHGPFGFGSVTFTVINTGLRDVKIHGFVLRASPRFGPADSGDIAYDRIQVIEDVGLQCNEGSGVPLVGSILAFQQSCSTLVPFFTIDNDPFDEFNPVPDSADWAVLLQVSATELNGAPVPDEIGHAYVRVVDDPVPEPGTAALVSSGLLLLSSSL
jgi:hypothetical protein